MEDNVHNELIENGALHSFLRSGTNRSLSEQKSADAAVISSKSKVRQRIVKEQKCILSQSQETTTYSLTKNEMTESYFDRAGFDEVSSKEHHKVNGLVDHKYVEKVSGSNTVNNLAEKKHIEQYSNTGEKWWTTKRRDAHQFYKAAGDWWNAFQKTDYSVSKSSTSALDVASDIQTSPNMTRQPLASYLRRRNLENSTAIFTHNYSSSSDISDDVDTVSSAGVVERSFMIRIISTVWHLFTSIFSVVTHANYLLGKGFQSTFSSRSQRRESWYHHLEFMLYQSACSFLLLDTWILSLFHNFRQHDNHVSVRKKHSKYLLLLLIPPLLMAGLWYNSTNTSATAVLSTFFSEQKQLLPSMFVQKTDTPDVHKYTAITFEDRNMELLVQKILSSSEFKNILLLQDFRYREQQLQKEKDFVSGVEMEQEKLKAEIDKVNNLLNEQRILVTDQQKNNKNLILENSVLRNQIEQLELQMKTLQAHRLLLSRRVGDCRKIFISTVPRVEIEQHVTHFLSGLFDTAHKGEFNNAENIKTWLTTLVSAKDNLERHLANLTTVMDQKIEEASGKSADTIMASVSDMIKQEFLKQESRSHSAEANYVKIDEVQVSGNPCDGCSLSVDKIKEIVNNALHLYDADKTGMVDYALESAGGTVINIRCTENYNDKSLALAFLGMTFPWSSNHPRIALQPEVHPGRCWAFRGAQGYLVIRLAKTIKVSAFSIEHIPVSISHTGNIDAAPKNFSVWGLKSEKDHDPLLLGKYMYQNSGPPLQIFPVQNEDAPPYQIVELAIVSNHGNLEYTCLYRFRVHGVVV